MATFYLLIFSTHLYAQALGSTQENSAESNIDSTHTAYSESNDTQSIETEAINSQIKASDQDIEQVKSVKSQESNTDVKQAVFDIDVLIERMKQTDAIGVISKLSLKNKVDDLLEQADEIKTKQSDADISKEKSALREDFEGLILKTVTLLNKGEDFTLAEDIYLAREELWKSIMENKA